MVADYVLSTFKPNEKDLMDEKSFSNFFVEFNHLANREKKRFEDYMKEE